MAEGEGMGEAVGEAGAEAPSPQEESSIVHLQDSLKPASSEVGSEQQDVAEAQSPTLSTHHQHKPVMTEQPNLSSSVIREHEDPAEALVQRATPWLYYAAAQAQELKQSMAQSTDIAVKSARAQLGDLQNASSHHYSALKDVFENIEAQYRFHEESFFSKMKDGIKLTLDHPTLSISLASGAILLLLRRPRRLLFRYTIGRFRNEEEMLTSAEKKVKEMHQSIDIMHNESKKLEERVRLAEEELVRGQTKLKNAGSQIRSLIKTFFKTESHAKGLVDNLRELPGRDALRLRAEVASMAAKVKQQRIELDKKLGKISKYGILV